MKHVLALATLTVAATAALAILPASAVEPSKTLLVNDAGGQWVEAVAKCIDEPFFQRTGIKVTHETPGGMTKLQAMSEAGVITGALLDAETGEVERAKALGLLDPIEWDKIKPLPMFEEAKQDYAIGTSYYSTIMAWRSDAKAPGNFVDFFDTKNFPGKRALPNYPGFILPFAALGDGVPVDQLFPLDLDRAFKTLERIKDDTIWWEAGAQAPQLLQDNEAQYAISWSGRVAGKEGVTISFNQGMLDISWFMVPKGADPAEKEAAWLWLHEHLVKENQACVAQYISYPGPSPELDPLLPQDRLNEFPTYSENKKVQWLTNAKWWYDNADLVQKRWEEFKLQQ
jgi:putative spermidine/putrescine transport system substrate-binding protein